MNEWIDASRSFWTSSSTPCRLYKTRCSTDLNETKTLSGLDHVRESVCWRLSVLPASRKAVVSKDSPLARAQQQRDKCKTVLTSCVGGLGPQGLQPQQADVCRSCSSRGSTPGAACRSNRECRYLGCRSCRRTSSALPYTETGLRKPGMFSLIEMAEAGLLLDATDARPPPPPLCEARLDDDLLLGRALWLCRLADSQLRGLFEGEDRGDLGA